MRTAVIIFLFCVASAWAQYSVPNLDPRVNDLEAVTDALDVRVGAVETGKAALVHGHIVSDVTGLQDALDGKVGTNDTRQLNWTGADVRVADGTQSNQPVTKAQLDGLLPASPVAGDLVKYDGTNWVATAKTWLEEDTVVYFYPTNTLSEIQATIDALPRSLNGHKLYLAFNNGTYNFSSRLYISGFVGGTTIFCTTSLVASTSTTAYTNQPIIFRNNGFLSDSAPIFFVGCSDLNIYDTKFWYADAHTNKNACVIIGCVGSIVGSMFSGSSTNAAVGFMSGLLAQRSIFDLRANYLDNVRYGVYATRGSVLAVDSHVSGPIRPAYDVAASGGVLLLNQTNLTRSVGGGGILSVPPGAILP